MDSKLILKKWEYLPDDIRRDAVRKYYNVLYKKRFSLLFKRIFDIVVAIFAIVILFPLLIIIGISIKLDSRGPILFRQVRVTQYGRRFKILKFRTMVQNAEKIGAQVTTKNDNRVTKIGSILRKYRFDEFPQLFNILAGDMSFVGTRPEVVKYVERYNSEMMATLLLPAGITSEASIQFKDEEKLLVKATDADFTYINNVLPEKMKYNLNSIKSFSFTGELKTMIKTLKAVFKKD
ncbi:sugar transferase [Bacillus toyonensis]|uniref:sugar transferase n=1 Tax=Bacillus toyonensis TaxID=155322 RepID=UPI000BFBC8C3|nr:sugar transferase [Bacillus toyonensis]PHF43406.1 glycosyl transferase [Bacillus toyonensis]